MVGMKEKKRSEIFPSYIKFNKTKKSPVTFLENRNPVTTFPDALRGFSPRCSLCTLLTDLFVLNSVPSSPAIVNMASTVVRFLLNGHYPVHTIQFGSLG